MINPEFVINFDIVISIGESFFQISELNFTPREGRETPLKFTPGGPLQSILGKSGKILLKSGQFV